jgi:hypothetical protein
MAQKAVKKVKSTQKNILKSKTVWLNLLTVVIIPLLPQSIKPFISQPEVLAAILALLNVAMRLISKDKVSLF